MDKAVTFQFLKAGMLTTIQDKGRLNYQKFGIPVGGAMDEPAATIANSLVGNSVNYPTLEITLLGPTIQINKPIQIALTGADLSPKLNGQPMPMYETINLSANSLISFGKINKGCRAYLAIRGDWQIEQWLNSYSAMFFAPSILANNIIRKGNILKITPKPFMEKAVYPKDQRPSLENKAYIRVIPGPEFEAFTKYNIGQFFSQYYRISNHSNRIGYRLEGTSLHFEPHEELISSGIIAGTVQIDNAGLPIIMMRDAQTVGGYYRIATVVSEDINVLAQMKAGDMLRFCLMTQTYFLTPLIN